MESESPNGSLDEDLAAAFEGEFGDEEEPSGDSSDKESVDGGNSQSSSDIDLDEMAEEGYAEVEALREEAGVTHRPAKRQRVVTFGAVTVGDVADPSPDGDMDPGPATASGGNYMGRNAATAGASAAPACAHPVWVFGLCGVCGVSKEAAEEAASQYGQYLSAAGPQGRQRQGGAGGAQAGAVRLKHLHANAEVEVSRQEAERIRRDTVSRLLSRRRLILILDLDHTLLNSVHTGEVDADAAQRLAELQAREQEANLGPRRLLHCLADKKLWTKLRPGVFEFLEGLRDAYEMHIYTMGDKSYAAEVRRLLDPGGRLFTSVIAKDHSTTTTAKHLDVLLSADELALVLDDTELVWPGHRRNLLQIERYHFFPSDLRKWRADGTALLEQGRDEDPTEGALATHMRVLRAVHARFFSREDPSLPPLERRDVREVLAEHRSRILQGCSVTFSRCWPQDRDPRREPLWHLAEGLGATCLTGYDPETTTHVVAAAGGTEKVHLARAQGKAVVTPAWLQGCGYRWQRLPEPDFALPEHGGRSGGGAGRAPGGAADDGGAGGGRAGGAGGGSKLSAEEELRVVMAVAGGGGAAGS